MAAPSPARDVDFEFDVLLGATDADGSVIPVAVASWDGDEGILDDERDVQGERCMSSATMSRCSSSSQK